MVTVGHIDARAQVSSSRTPCASPKEAREVLEGQLSAIASDLATIFREKSHSPQELMNALEALTHKHSMTTLEGLYQEVRSHCTREEGAVLDAWNATTAMHVDKGIAAPRFSPPKSGSFHVSSTMVPPHKAVKAKTLDAGNDDVFLLGLQFLVDRLEMHGQDMQSTLQSLDRCFKEFRVRSEEKLRIAEETRAKEASVSKWSIGVQVFSWVYSFLTVLAGVGLISSGVGAVAGAMLVTGGLMQMGNEIMEITRGWEAIYDRLPGDDKAKKGAVIKWIQIGIVALSMALVVSGICMGGYTAFSTAFSTANVFMVCGALMGSGITTIGNAIAKNSYNQRLAALKQSDNPLTLLRGEKEELTEQSEEGLHTQEQTYAVIAALLSYMQQYQAQIGAMSRPRNIRAAGG